MRLLLVLLLLMPATGAHAAEATRTSPVVDARFDGAVLVADVDVLQRVYTRLHPGLYRYASPARVDRRFDRLRRELAAGATLPQAYAAFSRFAASVRCGHTYANFHNQPAAIRAALFEGGDTRLPFHFRWIGRRMVVTSALSATTLPRGTEVLSIDGVPAGRVLDALLPYARADGSNDAKRVAQLQVLGHEKYEPFDVYLPLAFPAMDGRFELALRRPGDRSVHRMRVDGVTWAQRLAMRPASADRAVPWTLDRSRPGVAVLDMPTWALYDSPWDWQAFLSDAMAKLEADRVPALVIDLRANEGGLDVGDVLLSHLVDRPVARPVYRHVVRYRRIPAELRPYLDTWDRSFDDWGDAAQPDGTGAFVLSRWQPPGGGAPVLPKAPRYTGRVYVLTSPDNSSATFQFAQLVRASGRATLVGEATGGNLRGINGSAYYFVRLPGSKIELDMPLVAHMPTTAQPDRGVAPDIHAAPGIDSIRNGGDAAIDAVLDDLRLRQGARERDTAAHAVSLVP